MRLSAGAVRDCGMVPPGASGTTSMRAVGPGIANALVATAMGLATAIPAAVAYNYFGHRIKEMGARMEDFTMEFLNLTERNLEGPSK